MDPRLEALLRRLALNDEATVELLVHIDVSEFPGTGLDPRTHALVRLASLIALQSSPMSFEWGVTAALAAGATDEQIVGVLVAVAPVVGVARLNRASVDIATAVGYDLDLPEQ